MISLQGFKAAQEKLCFIKTRTSVVRGIVVCCCEAVAHNRKGQKQQPYLAFRLSNAMEGGASGGGGEEEIDYTLRKVVLKKQGGERKEAAE